MNPVSASERLMFTTVRLVSTRANGEAVGTGFFFGFPRDDGSIRVLLITNKHVIKDSITLRLHLHRADESGGVRLGAHLAHQVDLPAAYFLGHPDSEVDLCAMDFTDTIESFANEGTPSFFRCISKENIFPDEKLMDLRAVEDVLMIGYPNGLYDTEHNLPLIRRGITSTHPGIDYRGTPNGVVDIACFGGSSGSPVLIVNEGMFQTKTGGVVAGSNRIIFLGVLHSGPQVTSEGKMVTRAIPTAVEEVPIMPLMMHLGYYAKAKKVLDLVEMFKA